LEDAEDKQREDYEGGGAYAAKRGEAEIQHGSTRVEIKRFCGMVLGHMGTTDGSE